MTLPDAETRNLLGLLPTAHAAFTEEDSQVLLGIVLTQQYHQVVGGSLTFNGSLGRFIYIGVSGSLTPIGNLGRFTKRGLGGNLTFNGNLGAVTVQVTLVGGNLTFNGNLASNNILVAAVGGQLTFNGALQALNPDWLLIPDYLNWMGVWVVGTTYAIGDAVLFTEGDRPFAYTSKAGGNLGNTPGTTTWWYPIQQEPWRKA